MKRNLQISQAVAEAYAQDLEVIADKTFKELSARDLRHLYLVKWAGRLTFWGGLVLCGRGLSLLGAFLVSFGTVTNWMVAHHVLHQGYDQVPGVPARYLSRNYARGWRRFVDWLDWMHPGAWIQEHNILHHYQTGLKGDPDQVERNFKFVRDARIPQILKVTYFIFISLNWKWAYYAPSTYHELLKKKGLVRPERFDFYWLFNPFNKYGARFWRDCLLPYPLLRFVLAPVILARLFGLPVWIPLVNLLVAELMTNFHSFLIIAPNHIGEDVFRFRRKPKGRAANFVHQTVGSVNFTSTGPLMDLFLGYLNFQIEHHLWPDLPMAAYRRVSGEVRSACDRHQIPYLMEPVHRRFFKLAAICIGKKSMPWFQIQDDQLKEWAPQELDPVTGKPIDRRKRARLTG